MLNYLFLLLYFESIFSTGITTETSEPDEFVI